MQHASHSIKTWAWLWRKVPDQASPGVVRVEPKVENDTLYPPTPLPARGRRWGSVRLALERDCGSLLPSLSPSPVQPCTLPAFFLSLFSCSSSFLFFPFPFCCRRCRRTPLVRARCGEASAASKRAGREAVLAGCGLGTDSFLLSIWDSKVTFGT